MKIAIMQPYFFPYLGYWQLLNAVDKFVVLDDVNFIKNGFINRNKIASGGRSQQINIVIKGISSNKLILEHELDNTLKWKRKLLITIKQNYSKSKYFKEVFPLIEECILYDDINLSKYLGFQIKRIAAFLNINTKIIESSAVYPKNDLRAQDRVIDICKRESASTYINSIGGQELYSKQEFELNKIDLNFIEMNNVKYPQLNNEFVPNLSIIDVMMFNSVDQSRNILKKYSLK